jgi:glycosyltransferase involved in cell wall biosynthesis
MKVCLLSRFFDLRNGGIGRYSQNLLVGLTEQKIKVKCVSQDGGIPLGEGSAKYLIYTTLEIPFKTPDDYDIYHACSPLESIWLKKKNSVVTIHDLIPMSNSKIFRSNLKLVSNLFFGYLFNFALKRSINLKLIANSIQTSKDLINYFKINEESVRVIRPGISTNLKPTEKKDNIYRIGTLSYLESRKRIDLLIKAFLNADIENSELVIAGQGVDAKRLKKISKGDIRIKFLGFIPDSDLCEFYNSLDVFVFPSIIEGYGLPIVEALACKKPVITLKDAIIPDDVKSNTTQVNYNDLSKTLKNREYEYKDSNFNFVKEHSWKILIEKTLKMYKELLDNHIE